MAVDKTLARMLQLTPSLAHDIHGEFIMARPIVWNIHRATLALFVTGSLLGMGCMAGEDDMVTEAERTAEVRSGIGGDPGTHNHFRPYCFWDHSIQQTARDLATTAIRDEKGYLPSMPYLQYLPDQTCRQEALEVLIGCALPEGEKVVDTEDADRVYEGELGFAEKWMYQPMSTSDQERVTGCLLERLNAYGIKMKILLSNLPDFPADAAAQALYPVTESQAWGNLFSSTNTLNPTHNPSQPSRPPFDAYVCSDAGLYTCSVAGTMYTQGRICDNGVACGMVYTGQCNTACPHGSSTLCSVWNNRVYTSTPDDEFCDRK